MRTPPTTVITAVALLFLAPATLAAPTSAAGVRIVQPAARYQSPFVDPAAATPAWLQFGYDSGHSGLNPSETTLSQKNVATLALSWNDTSITQPGGIVVDQGVAYVDDLGQSSAGLYALNASTGKQKWFAQLNLNGPWGSFNNPVAAVAGNVVVSPCSDGQSDFRTGVCGVNKTTGAIAWTHYCTEYQGNPCSGLVNGGTSPALYGGRIYVQELEGVNEQPDTEALDPKTGALVWDVPGVYHCPDAGLTSGKPLPALNGRVFAVLGCASQKGSTEICALNATSGAAAWCDVSPTAYVEETIAADGKLFVSVNGNTDTVFALNAQTGAQEWSTTLPASAGTLAFANQRLFASAGGAGVFAMSAATGKPLWTYGGNGNFVSGGALSVANGVVYTDGFGGNNGDSAVTALNAGTGALISTTSGNGSSRATPVILNGRVYAACYTMCAFALPGAQRF